ncbi:TcdA/TcdB catalytic glycosyltransferase domain-containing protein [Rickettsiella endosymbiont of Miltochrista miniata]|uniref:TcdA/TcdB catalytic glycosyltransferase domain-containing protein n=1 Tax=Rickettsiella endosymbiont of Miltochrista miniata TaxID=3066239 RepID=UPI00313DCB1B
MPNSAAIPSELHFIWLGSPLPKKYLITLLELIPIARRSGFKINLWVDHPSHYYQSLDRYMPDLELSAQSSFLQVKELGELKHEMKSNEFFLQGNTHNVIDEIKAGAFTRRQDRYSDFWQCVEREMIGAKNFAAASNLLRYTILYLKGGYYFDTDTKFDFFNIIRDQNRKWLIQSSLLDGKYTLCAEQFPLEFSSVWWRNDILAAVPKHPILEITIGSALDAYNDLDKLKLSDSGKHEKTEMDKKRYNHRNPQQGDRLELTSQSSGSLLLTEVIEACQEQVLSSIEKSQLDTLAKKRECLTSKKVSFANLSIDIAETTDLTWLKPDKIPVKAFDDSAIPSRSRYGFFTRQAEENKSNSEKQISQQTSSSPILRN